MSDFVSFFSGWRGAAVFFLIGSFFGSFANVLIFRMIRNIQNGSPLNLMGRSRCPHCQYIIPFYLNIPLFSWLFLRGQCKNCGKAFSFRYFLIELLLACLFSALFLQIGWKWFLLEALLFAFALAAAGAIDWDTMILPDAFTLSGIALGLLGAALNPERAFLDSFFGVLFGGGILWLVAVIYQLIREQEGLGGGDIKLLAWIGAVLGWRAIPFVTITSCLAGALAGLILMLRSGKEGFQTAIPFGPYLAGGAALNIFLRGWGDAYISFFIPF